jgi:phospholipase C
VLTRRQFLGAAAAGAAAAAFPAIRLGRAAGTPLKNIVVLMQENRSFDHYFGLFPGAEGPPPCASLTHATSLCLASPPHDIDAARAEATTGFAPTGGATALTYYTGHDLPYYWALAARFTLCDHYFASALGGTAINRTISVAGAAGTVRDNDTLATATLPDLNIADRLDEAGVDWRCYQAGPTDAGYNPFRYFAHRASDPRAARPFAEFLADAGAGRLPPVCWIAAEDPLNEHGPDDVSWGERFVALCVNRLATSPQWKDSAMVLAYDENGGFYDHLSPPRVDELGLGFRVPALVASPYARAGHVSSAVYEHCSTLALIERTFGLKPMASRDTAANPFEDAFDFGHREFGCIDYPERPLDSCSAPAGWYGQLLSLPVPRSGTAGIVSAARPLCESRPSPDLAAGLGAAAAITGVAGVAARSGRGG